MCVAIFFFLAIAACTTATAPTTWTRSDHRAIDPTQLEADHMICRAKMEDAERLIVTRGLVPIPLPGQESPTLKAYNECMAERGYAAAR
jgi:hypothetical protein